MDGDGSGKIELNELVKNMAFQVLINNKFLFKPKQLNLDPTEEGSLSS